MYGKSKLGMRILSVDTEINLDSVSSIPAFVSHGEGGQREKGEGNSMNATRIKNSLIALAAVAINLSLSGALRADNSASTASTPDPRPRLPPAP